MKTDAQADLSLLGAHAILWILSFAGSVICRHISTYARYHDMYFSYFSIETYLVGTSPKHLSKAPTTYVFIEK